MMVGTQSCEIQVNYIRIIVMNKLLKVLLSYSAILIIVLLSNSFVSATQNSTAQTDTKENQNIKVVRAKTNEMNKVLQILKENGVNLAETAFYFDFDEFSQESKFYFEPRKSSF